MKKIGLTGGSGVGKSYVARIFARQGVVTVDCDAISRKLCTPGSPCVADLTRCFGATILYPDGSLNRRLLAELALPDPAKREQLNRITHAHILPECDRILARAEQAGVDYLLWDAPTLFESGLYTRCDVCVAVTANRAIRLARILARDALSEAAALHRLDAQPSDAFYRERCAYEIVNDGIASVEEQVTRILACLQITQPPPPPKTKDAPSPAPLPTAEADA